MVVFSRLFQTYQAAWQMVKRLKKQLQTLGVRLSAGWMLILPTVVQCQALASSLRLANLCNVFRVAFMHGFNTKPRPKG